MVGASAHLAKRYLLMAALRPFAGYRPHAVHGFKKNADGTEGPSELVCNSLRPYLRVDYLNESGKPVNLRVTSLLDTGAVISVVPEPLLTELCLKHWNVDNEPMFTKLKSGWNINSFTVPIVRMAFAFPELPEWYFESTVAVIPSGNYAVFGMADVEKNFSVEEGMNGGRRGIFLNLRSSHQGKRLNTTSE